MIIKCKMCGGDLNIQEGNPICECEFCGTQQTVPQLDDEKKANLFNRANKLRMSADFDKAATVYASITAEYPEEAEAYWGLCLCKYGIEYVDDPVSGEKIPTCHRTLTDSIMDDNDFDQACENADPIAIRLYRKEAKEIDRIQQSILSIVANEDPYDVFICYKETDEEGNRTEDSVLAQEIYDVLIEKGLKVFFSRITLEDKLGQQYEPYIYAALHSARVMLAIGTKFEYYNAVWVKNEWARFLSMLKTEKGKTLIPCYKDLDAYDMPKEFKNLQAQDMGKLGWLQDLTRGVLKLCFKDDYRISSTAVQSVSPQIKNFLELARTSLDSQNYSKAEDFCNLIISMDASNYDAWRLKGKAIGNHIENDNSRRKETYNCLERAYQLIDDEIAEQEKREKAKEIIRILVNCLNKETDYGMEIFGKESPKEDSFIKQKEALLEGCKLISMLCTTMQEQESDYLKDFQNHFCEECEKTCDLLWKEKVAYNYFFRDLSNYGRYWNRDPNVDEYVSENTYRPSVYTFSRFLNESTYLIEALQFCESQLNDTTPYLVKEKIYSDLSTYCGVKKDSYGYLSMKMTTRDGNGDIVQVRPFYRIDRLVKDSVKNELSDMERKYANKSRQAAEERKKQEKEIADEKWRIMREQAQQEAEKKKKRIEQYWNAHIEEYNALEARKTELKDQIIRINNEIKKIEESEELKDINKQIESVKLKWSSLGIFKSKEKKVLQEQYTDLKEQAKCLEDKIKGEVRMLNDKLNSMQKEFDAVVEELDKDRPVNDS